MPQIQAEAVLVAVGQSPGSAHRLARRGLPKSVGIDWTLDLDDLGTQIGEQPAQFTAGDDHSEVEDPDAVERARRAPGIPCRRG